jgi:hypothetical protein
MTKRETDFHLTVIEERHSYPVELNPSLLRFLGLFAKLQKTTISFVMSVSSFVRPSFGLSVCLSVRPHGITRLPLDGFS